MKQLPSEILNKIFLYLHPVHKVDCMLVCQHWKQAMENSALYYALELYLGVNVNSLIAVLKANPDRGKKVEHLSLYLYDDMTDFKPDELLQLLPNLRTLLFTGPNMFELTIKPIRVYPWSKHIEHISENTLNSVTYSLLSSNLCPHLTTIDLVDAYCNLLYLLKQAPALAHVTLHNMRSISFDDLDTVHESAPLLQSFTVYLYSFHSSELPQRVKPAMSVTECYFHGTERATFSLEAKRNLLIYASKKYPRLSKFKYIFSVGFLEDNPRRKLTDLDWLPLFQSLGSQLKTLSICGHGWDGSTFGVLDTFNCQIECVEINSVSSAVLVKVIESRQVLYIQTLCLNDASLEAYSWLKELHTLKELKVSFSSLRRCSNAIELGVILNYFPPTLTSLSLRGVQLNRSSTCSGLSTTITSLSFTGMQFLHEMDTFISQCFPKLTNLKLDKCNVMGNKWQLEKMDLLNFTYKSHSVDDRVNVSIVTYDNERRWYTIGKKHRYYDEFLNDVLYRTIYPPVKSRPQRDTDTELQFTLICNSLVNFVLM